MFRGVGSYTKPPEREKDRRNPSKCYPPDKVSEVTQECVSLYHIACLVEAKLFTRYLLLVTCYFLLATRYFLLVTHCFLLVTRYFLLFDLDLTVFR